MASTTETIVARTASSRLRGRRISSSSTTGRPVHSEVPKSRCATPQSQLPNCTTSGWSSPSRRCMAASCARSMWPASPPRIRRATSPGMTRMITNTREATPSSVGTIRRTRLARYVHIRLCQPLAPPSARSNGSDRHSSFGLSVLRQPDVLKLLVRVVTGRRHIVLQLGPVHDVARPPEARHVVRVLQHDLLELDDHLLPLGWVEGSRLSRKQIIDPGIGEAAPVLGAPRDISPEELIGVVH